MPHFPAKIQLGVIPGGILPIVLPQALPGFEMFIVTWLIPGPPALLVDPGPASSVPILCRRLAEHGIMHLDAVLLTHIHLDHAGGAGELARRYPDTLIVCDTRAHPYLAAPGRLWEQSRKVLGPVADAYGPPRPVPMDRLSAVDTAGRWGVVPMATPGHAAGHTAYGIGTGLLAGEAIGVHLDLGESGIYRRPASPPRFLMETAVASVALIEAAAPEWLCFGHVGGTCDPRSAIAAHRRQLNRWTDAARVFVAAGADSDTAAEAMVRQLLAEDPDLAGFGRLAEAEQRRELFFLTNSAKGILGAVNAGSGSK